MNKQALVSVVMITYGHENYIKQAIESILMQECNFDFEVIVSNDNSPDQTDFIIKRIISEHPKSDKIKYYFQEKNLGMMPNFIYALNQAKSKYIALCDGDDYWTDPLKLKKQVGFLENNSDYSVSVGKFQIYYEKSKRYIQNKEIFNFNQSSLTLKNYIAFNFSHTSTFLYRNNFKLPTWLTEIHSGDQSIFILATNSSKIKYFNDSFSVYRINNESISFKVNAKKSQKNTLIFLNLIDDLTQKKYSLLINSRKKLNTVYYYLESSNNRISRTILKILAFSMRWFNCNVLVKFVK